MANKWVEHIKACAKKNGVNFPTALRSAECKASYYSKRETAPKMAPKKDRKMKM